MTHLPPIPPASSLSCNSDTESFGDGILLSLGFSTYWSVHVFPGKVTFHPSLEAKTVFLVSFGVVLLQSHNFFPYVSNFLCIS